MGLVSVETLVALAPALQTEVRLSTSPERRQHVRTLGVLGCGERCGPCCWDPEDPVRSATHTVPVQHVRTASHAALNGVWHLV